MIAKFHLLYSYTSWNMISKFLSALVDMSRCLKTKHLSVKIDYTFCYFKTYEMYTNAVSSVNDRGQAENEFKVEVEAIGKVRHKNLVCLIGFCAEGSQRYNSLAIWFFFLYNLVISPFS